MRINKTETKVMERDSDVRFSLTLNNDTLRNVLGNRVTKDGEVEEKPILDRGPSENGI